MRSLTSVLLAAIVCLFTNGSLEASDIASSLADGQTGVIYFQSSNPPTFSSMIRQEAAPAAKISGELRFPEKSTGKVAAVVIGHGSGGLSHEREYAWADYLRSLGYATFVVDSFTARGLTQVATNQSALPFAASVADLLYALKLLSSHPNIDPQKIAVIGFSRGGFAALYSTIERIRSAVIDSPVKFAAHIPFYPGCVVMGEKYTGAPVQVHLGDNDDYQNVPQCERYVSQLRSKGVKAELIIYPGARHGFDRTDSRLISSSSAETWKDCDLTVNIDTGVAVRHDTGVTLSSNSAVFEYYKSCSKFGVRVEGSSKARERAKESVRAFLNQIIGP